MIWMIYWFTLLGWSSCHGIFFSASLTPEQALVQLHGEGHLLFA
jgi:hypothetical protein